jgi:hypothetical protein
LGTALNSETSELYQRAARVLCPSRAYNERANIVVQKEGIGNFRPFPIAQVPSKQLEYGDKSTTLKSIVGRGCSLFHYPRAAKVTRKYFMSPRKSC